MSDLLTAPLNLIRDLVGGVSSGGAIPFFDPFYNLVVLLWMGPISAIFVCPFWKKFRAFAVFLTWLAIFTTLAMRGSSPEGLKLDVLSAYFNMSLSVVLLVLFVILTIWLFGRLLKAKVSVPKVG